jgi:iron complex transport system permease protein
MRAKYIQWIIFITVMILLLFVAVVISLWVGEVKISLRQLPEIFANKEGIEYTVLSKIRFPRLVLAIAVGGALSLSGAILQGIYRNPLVEPYTLGISGGAALGIALVMILGLQSLGFFVMPVFGFAGAVVTLFLVYFLSIRRGGLSINSMLLIGVMVSFISSSAMMFFNVGNHIR